MKQIVVINIPHIYLGMTDSFEKTIENIKKEFEVDNCIVIPTKTEEIQVNLVETEGEESFFQKLRVILGSDSGLHDYREVKDEEDFEVGCWYYDGSYTTAKYLGDSEGMGMNGNIFLHKNIPMLRRSSWVVASENQIEQVYIRAFKLGISIEVRTLKGHWKPVTSIVQITTSHTDNLRFVFYIG